ncbi:hypothetical protein E4U54_007649, partial [Claviceps lovelessii]
MQHSIPTCAQAAEHKQGQLDPSPVVSQAAGAGGGSWAMGSQRPYNLVDPPGGARAAMDSMTVPVPGQREI